MGSRCVGSAGSVDRSGSGWVRRWPASGARHACGSAAEERKERERGGAKEKKKEKGKRKMEKKKREKERETAEIAAATAAERTRAPVGHDARDEGEQGDGTAIDSDVGTGFLGDREIGRERFELNDEKVLRIIFSACFILVDFLGCDTLLRHRRVA